MITRTLGRMGIGLAVGMLLLGAAPASALNEVYESSCGPSYPCVKTPKENICARQYGDLGASGEMGTMFAALAKGKKGTMVKIDLTFEWFTLSNQFRPIILKVNNKFAVNFVILNHLDSCPSGFCLRHATFWYDLDLQESVYPGEFYNQPLEITVTSAKVADAGSQYNATLCAQVLKKK